MAEKKTSVSKAATTSPAPGVPSASLKRPLPDPIAAARAAADTINADRAEYFDGGLGRVLRDAPWLDRRAILEGVAAYHREAMIRIPPKAQYPEAGVWVDYLLKYEKELRTRANLSDQELGIVMSLGDYLTFRGNKITGLAHGAVPQAEKCRIAFVPETDEGPVWIKNVDDPPNHWHPVPPLPVRGPRADFQWEQSPVHVDGVGSGLHIDDEPEQVFPLNIRQMWEYHVEDTPGCLEFMRRYKPFFGGQNIVIMDRQFRVKAVEKCSRNHMEEFEPDANGHSHVSGMACRDANSPQGRYQRGQRELYRKIHHLPADGPDNTFWAFCDQGERKLVEGLKKLGRKGRCADLFKLFWTLWPNGLAKNGVKIHPEQGHIEYTLITHATLIQKRCYVRWQRNADCSVWPEQPEVCQYE